jgi:hypothetical protein
MKSHSLHNYVELLEYISKLIESPDSTQLSLMLPQVSDTILAITNDIFSVGKKLISTYKE